MNKSIKSLFGLAAVVAAGMSVYAAVTFDPATGTGFVGKGDVQLALGLNNNQIQNTPVNFTVSSTTVQETSWDCINTRNENIQERSRTTTTETQGVLSSIARERNQITGFFLTGYAGQPTSTSSTEGPQVGSCPNANSSYVQGSIVVGEPEVTAGGLYVNGVLLQ